MAKTLPKEETDRFVTINDVELHYNEAGSGPALICTHGGGPGANAWDNTKWIFGDLAENYHTVLLDAPGYGESQKYVKRNDVPLDIYFGGFVLGLMDHLDIERAHLHGSAQFGATMVRLAAEYPDRVGKVILSCAAIGQAIPGAQKRDRSPGMESLTTFSNDPTIENMAATVKYFNKRPEFQTDEIINMRYQAAMRPGVIESRLEMSAASNSDLTEILPKIQTETLILWGNEDQVSYVDGALRSLYNIPNSRAVIFGDDSGHFVFMEHPDECVRYINDFLLS